LTVLDYTLAGYGD